MRRRYGLPVLLSLLSFVTAQAVESVTVSSPNGKLGVQLSLQAGIPNWYVHLDGRTVLRTGKLGVEVDGAAVSMLEAVAAKETTHQETVATVWGKFAAYDDHYNQLAWTLRETKGSKRTLRIVIRVYDSGLGLRYEFPADGGWGETVSLTGGHTEFRFGSDGTGWCYHREHDPVGPQPLSQFHAGQGADLPLTVELGPRAYVAILEAAILQQAPFRLTPLPNDSTGFAESFSPSEISEGDASGWRTVLIGRQPGDLLTSPVLYCLNPPCAIDDPSWIQPGLAFWDWRAWGATTKDGFQYDLDMASWRRFIDFASNNHVRYLVLDANWYGPEFDVSSDPRVSRDHLVIQPDMSKPQIIRRPAPENWKDPINIPALIRYAKDRGVGIILYFNDIARLNYPFEETLALYHKWGAAGIKYGFMKGKGQQKVLDTREIVRMCAKYELLCDFHDGPVPPSGDERTYPNYVVREFCHSQSDAMRAFSPAGFCEQVFVNMLAGPLDMCNGLYTLENPARDRPRIFTNVDTTLAAETARVLITYSGMSILPDCPEAYAAQSDIFDFLRRLPMTWDETRILHGAIGQFICTARRNGDEWFIGSATNEQARTLDIELDFLQEGKSYTATLYEDGPDADYQKNRESYRVRQVQVSRGDVISAKMAPGGGHCIYLQPKR